MTKNYFTLAVLVSFLFTGSTYAVGTGIFAGNWSGPCNDNGAVYTLEKSVSQWKTLTDTIYINDTQNPIRPLSVVVGGLTTDTQAHAGGYQVQTTTSATWNADHTAMEIQISRFQTWQNDTNAETKNLVNKAFPAYETHKLSLDAAGHLIWEQTEFDVRQNFKANTVTCTLQKK